jgi:hypothetical protein
MSSQLQIFMRDLVFDIGGNDIETINVQFVSDNAAMPHSVKLAAQRADVRRSKSLDSSNLSIKEQRMTDHSYNRWRSDGVSNSHHHSHSTLTAPVRSRVENCFDGNRSDTCLGTAPKRTQGMPVSKSVLESIKRKRDNLIVLSGVKQISQQRLARTISLDSPPRPKLILRKTETTEQMILALPQDNPSSIHILPTETWIENLLEDNDKSAERKLEQECCSSESSNSIWFDDLNDVDNNHDIESGTSASHQVPNLVGPIHEASKIIQLFLFVKPFLSNYFGPVMDEWMPLLLVRFEFIYNYLSRSSPQSTMLPVLPVSNMEDSADGHHDNPLRIRTTYPKSTTSCSSLSSLDTTSLSSHGDNYSDPCPEASFSSSSDSCEFPFSFQAGNSSINDFTPPPPAVSVSKL